MAFDVVAFSLVLENNINIGSASAGGGAGKPSLRPLRVSVLPNQEAADLYQFLLTGTEKAVILQVPDSTGVYQSLFSSNFVVFNEIEVGAARNANQQNVLDLNIALGEVTLMRGPHESSYDGIFNQNTCTSTPCGCNALNHFSYAADAGQGIALPVDVLRAERFGASVGHTITIGSTSGGAGSGKATAGDLMLRTSLGDDVTCLAQSLFSGSFANNEVDFHLIGEVGANLGMPLFSLTQTLPCLVGVQKVTIASDEQGEIWVDSEWVAGAHRYTTRRFDPVTGSELTNQQRMTSWSFVRNDATDSCF